MSPRTWKTPLLLLLGALSLAPAAQAERWDEEPLQPLSLNFDRSWDGPDPVMERVTFEKECIRQVRFEVTRNWARIFEIQAEVSNEHSPNRNYEVLPLEQVRDTLYQPGENSGVPGNYWLDVRGLEPDQCIRALVVRGRTASRIPGYRGGMHPNPDQRDQALLRFWGHVRQDEPPAPPAPVYREDRVGSTENASFTMTVPITGDWRGMTGISLVVPARPTAQDGTNRRLLVESVRIRFENGDVQVIDLDAWRTAAEGVVLRSGERTPWLDLAGYERRIESVSIEGRMLDQSFDGWMPSIEVHGRTRTY